MNQTNLSDTAVTLAKGVMIGRLKTLAQDVKVNAIKSSVVPQDHQGVETPCQPIVDEQRLAKFSQAIDTKLEDNKLLSSKQKEEYKAMLLKHIAYFELR